MTHESKEAVRPVLESLHHYMLKMYRGELTSDQLPLEFWRIEDDGLFLEMLSYMPLHMGITDDGAILNFDGLPEAFRLAFPIFWLEDDYQVNGWTALTNAGEWLLPSAVAAYDRIGMSSEARALEAALKSCCEDPEDAEAAEAAYKSVPNVYADEDVKYEALIKFFRANANLFEAP